jgi:hypothetical protein
MPRESDASATIFAILAVLGVPIGLMLLLAIPLQMSEDNFTNKCVKLGGSPYQDYTVCLSDKDFSVISIH